MAEFGIHPHHRSDAPVADLVLVHGLMGNSRDTWAGKDAKGQRTYWPDWIKQQRPDVNIWLADYDSSVSAWAQPAMPLDQIGGSFLLHAKDQGLGERPVHWVGHSMGGLIIKHLLRQAREKADAEWHVLSGASRAITFLGTPHHGSDLAKWKEYFSFLLSAWDFLQTGGLATGAVGTFARTLKFMGIGNRSSHVDELAAHGKALGDLNDAFAQWLGAAARTGSALRVRNYYETLPVFKTVTVVPRHSAQLSNDLVVEAAVQANHFDICKFSSVENAVFKGIIVSLDRLFGGEKANVRGRPDGGALATALDAESQKTPEHPHDGKSARVDASKPVSTEMPPSSRADMSGIRVEQSQKAIGEPRHDSRALEENREMQDGVFISYAANDPVWTAERVEAFARELDGFGVCVHLDVRYEASMEQLVAPADWRRWMDECLRTAKNVICLCSERYAQAWERDESVSGGCGVAFESARIERYLYDRKQHNHGHVLVVTLDNLPDVVPGALRDACPQYVRGREKDDRFLRSHLSAARSRAKETGSSSGVSEGVGQSGRAESLADAGSPTGRSSEGTGDPIPLDRGMLKHQAEHAIESLQTAAAYWAALQASRNLKDWLTPKSLGSPSVFLASLQQCPADTLPRVMRELRNVFKDEKERLVEEEAKDAASATVACFLFCTCLLIRVDARDMLVGLPNMEERHAAHLLASLIALVMAGGRLRLHPGEGVLPKGSGTYRLQNAGINKEFDFERQLFSDLVKNRWSASAGQKTGALSDNERKELLEELRDLRGDDARTEAMCIIVDCEQSPACGVGVAREIGIPVFHVHADVAYELFGVSEATLVTHLKKLWGDVCSYYSPDAADAVPS